MVPGLKLPFKVLPVGRLSIAPLLAINIEILVARQPILPIDLELSVPPPKTTSFHLESLCFQPT